MTVRTTSHRIILKQTAMYVTRMNSLGGHQLHSRIFNTVRSQIRRHARIWILILICYVTCFLYQSNKVIEEYLTYPSYVTFVEVKEAAVFPALTVCLSPWYNITQVCDTLPCSNKDLVGAY